MIFLLGVFCVFICLIIIVILYMLKRFLVKKAGSSSKKVNRIKLAFNAVTIGIILCIFRIIFEIVIFVKEFP